MSAKTDVIVAVGAILFLAVWTWFWTGPELEWERSLQNARQNERTPDLTPPERP